MKKNERAGVPAKVRMSEKSLLEIFSRLDGQIPMHMPGHKRDLDEFPWLGMPLGKCDVTEISGFDDLYAPEGVLADILARLAALWGSRRAFLSVNGSTGAVFAALSLAGRNGVLAARNCHRSVFAAVKELGIRTEYVFPRTVSGRGFLGSVSPEDIAARLDETGCGAVVVTSPTYEGVMSDIAGIARAAHERGAVLIVDCAHGAHLGLSDAFPDGGVREGADIVVSSLHKTLPALTQTAVLHVCSDRVSEDAAASAIAAFCCIPRENSRIFFSSGRANLRAYSKKQPSFQFPKTFFMTAKQFSVKNPLVFTLMTSHKILASTWSARGFLSSMK